LSKFIFICQKNVTDERETVEKICNNIKPDNLDPNKPIVIKNTDDKITLGIFNPNESNLINGINICLGYVDTDEWYKVGSEVPDGNFALVRSNSDYVELISDIVASRTIWYVHTDEYFIASTSQRMLVSYLGSYTPNDEVISWMLSTGTLGCGLSWDKRIKCIPGDSRLTLNRSTWELNLVTEDIEFREEKASYSSHKTKLEKAIRNNITNMNIDFSHWALPLSGGYDSRGILLNLKRGSELKTLTWGLESSINESGSDAYVAKQLSEKMNLEHRYYHTDLSPNEDIQVIFERFLKIGEGRTDNIGGYLDGFNIWNILYNDGIQGVIRGDEGFGWVPVKTEAEALSKNGIMFMDEYDNLKSLLHELPVNKLPEHLQKRENESLEGWRDRLYHQFRIPTVLSALNDLKLSHVELINPLLSKEILLSARTLPDKLRTDKRLFKEIVDSFKVDVPYAKFGSNMGIKSIFKQDNVVSEIKKELQLSSLLPKQLIDFITDKMQSVDSQKKVLSKKEKMVRNVKASMPAFVKDFLKRNIPTNIDVNMLGFRAYIIVKMNEILISDANLIKERNLQLS